MEAEEKPSDLGPQRTSGDRRVFTHNPEPEGQVSGDRAPADRAGLVPSISRRLHCKK